MKVIGMCGGSGAGKGTVCSIFAELGIKSIDTDKLYHDIISRDSECTLELISFFGDSVYAAPGIDRRALRDIVFSSEENLAQLNMITHKHILAQVRSIINSERCAEGIIIDAPLLFESGFDKECDTTVCVLADEEIRIKRIIQRDGLTPDAARRRIASQIQNAELIKRCEYSIENNSTEEELRENIAELYKKMFNKK